MAPKDELLHSEEEEGTSTINDDTTSIRTTPSQCHQENTPPSEPYMIEQNDKNDLFIKREFLLDVFPLSKDELYRCFKCYERLNSNLPIATTTTTTFYTLVNNKDNNNSSSNDHPNDDYDDHSSSSTSSYSSSSSSSSPAFSSSSGSSSTIYLQRLRYAEATFLPESSRLIQYVYENAFVIGTYHDESIKEQEYKFYEAICTLIGRRSPRTLLTTIYNVAGQYHHDDHNHDNNHYMTIRRTPQDLASLVYRLILAAHFIKTGRPRYMRPAPNTWITSLQEKMKSSDGLSLTEWIDWVNTVAPQVHQSLSTFAHCAILGPNHPFLPTNPSLLLPITDQECSLWSDTYQTIPTSIALLSPQLGGKWIRQYSSDYDGFSFSTFQNALIRYQGPTVITIQTTAGDAFGFYSGIPWKESRHWFGKDTDSFLFGLKPSLRYYGPTGNDKPHCMYLYNPTIQRPGYLYGLCVGGVADQFPRLHITPSFERCKAQSMDGAYDTGPLLSNDELYFDVDAIEVWAVNVNEDDYAMALARGKAHQEWKEGVRVHTAKVDRRQFLQDFREGIFGSNLFEHRDQTRGRHSFIADDDEGLGYFIEEKPPTPNVSCRRMSKEEDHGATI